MTFNSRGVVLPFTTPVLAGSRVRACKRGGIELVMANPSGGRGIYVLDWSGIRAICNPTVHDTLLFRRVESLPSIEPASIREAALAIARQGYAGQDAAVAAADATERDTAQRVMARFLLIMQIVEQLSPSGRSTLVAHEQTGDLDRRATAVLQRIAASLRRPVAQLDAGLTAIGSLLAPAGVGAADRTARVPQLLIRLGQVRAALADWLGMDPDNDVGGLGQAVGFAMQQACESGLAMLRQTRAAAAEAAGLLKRWISDPASVAATASRCDWLLDGWERVSLLWLDAGSTACRRAALLEMAPLVPVLPREVLEWSGISVVADALQPVCRVTSQQEIWRTGGSAFGLIERNERLIAMSASDRRWPMPVAEVCAA